MSTWTLDPAHSEIEFAVKHMMVTTVRGQFRKFAVDVEFDEENPERSAVVAHIDASSIDTGMEARDAHLRSGDFVDAEAFPELSFRSTKIEPSGEDIRRPFGSPRSADRRASPRSACGGTCSGCRSGPGR